MFQSTKSVFCIDTRRQKEPWKEVPTMSKERSGHSAFAYGGKMYVVGGTGDYHRFAEVYNPKRNKWRLLRPVVPHHQSEEEIPSKFQSHAVLCSGGGVSRTNSNGGQQQQQQNNNNNKEVLFYNSMTTQLLSLDLESQNWRFFSHSLGTTKHATALVDGIIYCIDCRHLDEILAYDPSKPNSRLEMVSGPPDLAEYLPIPGSDFKITYFMVSLNKGGKLAVLWSLHAKLDSYPDPFLIICCSKFRMEKVTTVDKETGCEEVVGFFAHPLRHSVHYVPGRWFTNCLKIEPSGDVDLDDSETGGSAEESAGYKKRQKKRMRKKLTAKRRIMKKKRNGKANSYLPGCRRSNGVLIFHSLVYLLYIDTDGEGQSKRWK